MMTLSLSKGAHLIHKAQGRLKVRKGEVPFQMMVVYDLPLGHLAFQRSNFGSSQGWHSTPARNTCLFCKS